MELTPERIISFCEEATLLNSLQHENIVSCQGVAIMPPALSLVTEFCVHGSLFDFLHAKKDNQTMQRVLFQAGLISAEDMAYLDATTTSAMPQRSEDEEEGSCCCPCIIRWTMWNFRDHSTAHDVSGDIEDQSYNAGAGSFYRLLEEERAGMGISSVRSSPLLSARKALLSDSMTGDSYPTNRPSNEECNLLKQSLARSPQHSRDDGSSSPITTFATRLDNRSNERAVSDDQVVKRGFQPTRLPIRQGTTSARLMSPSSVMLTREMGFGLGPRKILIETEKSQKSQKSLSYSKSTRAKHLEESASLRSGRWNTRSLLLITGNDKSNVATTNALLSSLAQAATPNNPSDLGSRLGVNKESIRISSLLNSTISSWLPVRVRLAMMRDCCAGLAYLHSKGFIHCDIKSLNFLVTEDLRIKLADLGEARARQDMGVASRWKTLPSNINWSSPETLRLTMLASGLAGDASSTRLERNVTEAADVWSLAMVIFEIATGLVPFDDTRFQELTMAAFVDLLQDGLRPDLRIHGMEALPDHPYLVWLRNMVKLMFYLTTI
eukprot:scaffold865_cov160-Ochromonas_danica.AAC.19